MSIELTSEQWTSVQNESEIPVRVNVPAGVAKFVLMPADVYERFKSLFESDPVSPLERQFQMQQFGRRGGWDNPEMDVYEDFKPRA